VLSKLKKHSTQTNPTQTCILSEFIFTNSKIIDRSDHWSLLLFKESLTIRRLKPELNHGTKASKELIIFNYYSFLYRSNYLILTNIYIDVM
jgi:hypothetical protein